MATEVKTPALTVRRRFAAKCERVFQASTRKRFTTFFTVGLLVAATQLFAANGAAAKFEQLKQLAGTWHGKNPQDKMVTVTYEVVSNGSVVMERMSQPDESDMITMYHLDGDQLMMTHYCSAMNQPRMRAENGGDANVMAFQMFDITNLAAKEAGHMQAMTMTVKDADHIVHEWKFVDNGKEMAAPFVLTREDLSQK